MIKDHFFIKNEESEIEQGVTMLVALLHEIGKIRTTEVDKEISSTLKFKVTAIYFTVITVKWCAPY